MISKFRFALASSIALLAGLSSCTIHPTTKDSCATDADCLEGRTCVSGTCAAVAEGGQIGPIPDGATSEASCTPPGSLGDAGVSRPAACDDSRPGERVFFLSLDHLRTRMTGVWALCSGTGLLDAAAGPQAQAQVGVEILPDQQWSLLVRSERGELERLFGHGLSGVYEFVGFPRLPPSPTDAEPPPTSGSVATVKFGIRYVSVFSYDEPRRLVLDGSVYVPIP